MFEMVVGQVRKGSSWGRRNCLRGSGWKARESWRQ
jgi:hypothetical protein